MSADTVVFLSVTTLRLQLPCPTAHRRCARSIRTPMLEKAKKSTQKARYKDYR